MADYANLRFISLEMIFINQCMYVTSLTYIDVGNKLVARIVEYLDLTYLLMYAHLETS